MENFTAVISDGLTAERFGPYLRAVNGGDAPALALYEWNNVVSASFWADIAHFEVLVRNAMHKQMTEWSTHTYGEPCWYLDPGGLLTPRHRDDIATARRRATTGRRAKPETPGRIVAELNFGFWRYLVATQYDRTLWHGGLYKAFPGQGKRSRLHAQLVQLHELRNRIAHHEPIYREPLQRRHTELLTALEWMNPQYRQWVKQQSTVLELLAVRPT